MSKATFRVLTLNLWNRAEPWDARRVVLEDGLRALAPDVVGLQEAVKTELGDGLDQAELFARVLGHHHVYAPAFGSLGYPMGNAILSRWPILQHEALALPRGGSEEERCLLYARIDAPFGRIPVFCTHLNWKLSEAHVRAEQVRFIADTVSLLAPEHGFPAIVLGDFNAEPESDEMRFLRGLSALGGKGVYFFDALAVAGDPLAKTFVRKNPYAATCHEPDRRLDYVYVRGPDDRGRGVPERAWVCLDEPSPDGVYASDHFGVAADLAIGQ